MSGIVKKNQSFAAYLWLMAGLFALLALAFSIYVLSEKKIDSANDLRYQSLVVADELRQSSDDLTRMVRTYVVTGDPVFKGYFQDILDIRNGKKSRPDGYQNIYWDLVTAHEPPPHPGSGKAVALQTMMKRAGFTAQELQKLAEAQTNSDGLTAIEFEAMRLAETTGPEADANRTRARVMLHDAKYHRAKAAIMKPIDEFYELMEKRTLDMVQDCKRKALIFLGVFLLFGLMLISTLFRTKKVLDYILGTSVDEIYSQMRRIGGGDFSSAISVPGDKRNSVLGHLVEMQARLGALDKERQNAAREADDQKALLAELMAQVPGVVYQLYARPNGERGLYYISSRAEQIFGMKPDLEKPFESFVAAVVPENREDFLASNEKAIREVSEWKYEGRLRKPSGEEIWFSGHSMPSQRKDEIVFNGILGDITEIKKRETDFELLTRQMEFILGATKTGLDIIDSDFNMIYIDPEWAKVYGDYRGKKCYDYFMGKGGICANCGIVKALQTKEVVVSEEVLLREGNRLVQVTTIPFQDKKGAWLVAEVNADITSRKLEEELSRKNSEMVELLLNSTAEAIYGLDLTGSCTFVNAACVKILGYERKEELLGKNMHDMIHSKHADGLPYDVKTCPIFKAFKASQGTHVDNEVFWRKDGTSFYSEYWSYPVWREGTVVGAVVAFLDITDRKLLEEENRKTFQELEVFYKASMGREGRILELKEEVEKLRKELGKQP